MTMKKYTLLLLPLLALLLVACDKKDDPTKNQYSVFRKEYRTKGEPRIDEIDGNLMHYSYYQFDIPYNGNNSGYSNWRAETVTEDGRIVSAMEDVTPSKYKQDGQLVVREVAGSGGRIYTDTIISYGDSLKQKGGSIMYYYNGPVKVD